MADIERRDLRRAARKQHFREPARRCPDIKRPALGPQPEMIKRMQQLQRTPPDPLEVFRQLDFAADTRRRPHDRLAVDAHRTGLDQSARAASTWHQAKLDKALVKARSISHAALRDRRIAASRNATPSAKRPCQNRQSRSEEHT